MARAHRLAIIILTALALAASIGTTAAPVAQGAWSCRVRNVTQDAYGRSLKRMVERAHDGDRLRVRGVRPGEIVIGRDLVIRGLDGAVLTGNDRTRVVRVRQGATVTLQDVAIQHGHTEANGGGILNRGRLTLSDSTVRRNVADYGGGIWNDGGTITLTGSTVSGNTASSNGGIANMGRAILVDSIVRGNASRLGPGGIGNRGRMVLRRTTVSGNAQTRRQCDPYGGGGIENGDGGRLTLVDSTITANRAADMGGGILVMGGTVALTRSTVSGNTAGRGGGIEVFGGTVTLTDSTVSANTGGAGGGISSSGTLTLAGSSVSGNTSFRGGGILNWAGAVTLTDSTVSGNTATQEGGGILNQPPQGTVTLDATSSVTGNTPDDCVGTPAC